MHTLQILGYFQSYQLTWSYFLNQLVAGLTLGSLYGLMALGYSMVYGILKLLNFAHGEVFMIGSYIGYFVLVALGGSISPDVPVALLIILMFGAAMIGSGVLGVVIERFAYRPLRVARAPRIAPLISALGVSFCLQQLASIFFGTAYKQYDPFGLSGGTLTTPWHIGSLEMSWMQLLVILLTTAQVIWSPTKARAIPQFFAGHSVKIADVRVSYHDVTVVIVALIVAAFLRFLFTRTRAFSRVDPTCLSRIPGPALE